MYEIKINFIFHFFYEKNLFALVKEQTGYCGKLVFVRTIPCILKLIRRNSACAIICSK